MPRTLNSAKNLASSLSVTFIMILLGFLTRRVFVDNIGVEYLGLNGLLQNILGVMTLLEGGFAASVVYNMYKPLAEDDRPRILALLQLYRKIYRYIALGLILFALALYPFLGYFLKEAHTLHHVGVIYFLFVFNTVINYFVAYKWSLINTSQQNYKLFAINLTYQVMVSVMKLAILYYTKNYILYLAIESALLVLYNLAVIRKANKLFPYIVNAEEYQVAPEIKKNIITNMKALFLHKLGGYFMHSTDNLIITKFVSIATVGFYSNYTLITGLFSSLIKQTLNSFSESVGNLIASENSDKIYEVFRTTFLINFIVVSTPVIILYNTLTPFVSWWLGEEYVLSNVTVVVILVYFYVNLMRNTAYIFKEKSGIFVADRWTPLLQGIINVILSLIFVRYWDLPGVILGSIISVLSIGFWQFPRLCFRHVFHRPLSLYFKDYAIFTSIGVFCLVITNRLCRFVVVGNNLAQCFINGSITMCFIGAVYFVCFHKTKAYNELMAHVKILR
jgi:O-antigen/teichoic acid export membrane protein